MPSFRPQDTAQRNILDLPPLLAGSRFFWHRIRRPFGDRHKAYLKAKYPADLVECFGGRVGLPSFQFCDLPRSQFEELGEAGLRQT